MHFFRKRHGKNAYLGQPKKYTTFFGLAPLPPLGVSLRFRLCFATCVAIIIFFSSCQLSLAPLYFSFCSSLFLLCQGVCFIALHKGGWGAFPRCRPPTPRGTTCATPALITNIFNNKTNIMGRLRRPRKSIFSYSNLVGRLHIISLKIDLKP